MPQPIGTSLHTSVPLTNLSIAYQQEQNFIADAVFPVIGVQKQFDSFYRYVKADWFRTVAEERAPGTESVGTGWSTTVDTYAAKVYAVHKDLDDHARANADQQWSLERDATYLVTNDLLMQRELKWFSSYFAASVWSQKAQGTTTTATTALPATGFTQFDVAGSDPIRDVQRQALRMQKVTGRKPNTLVVTPDVDLVLKNHASIIDRVKYTQRGFVSEDLLAAAFGVGRYMVSSAIKNTALESVPATAAANESMDWVAPEGMLLTYVDPNPGLMSVTSGLTFAWNGLFQNAYGTRVKKFRMEAIASDRIEAEFAYAQNVVCPDLGCFFADPLVNAVS